MDKRGWIVLFFFIVTLLVVGYFIHQTEPTTPTVAIDHELPSGEISITDFSGEPETEPTVNSFPSIPLSQVKAVYSSGWVAGGTSSRQAMIQNIKEYGFNAVVLDIKDEAGALSYASQVQTAIDIGASRNMIHDINAVIQEFHENDIYVIGRIVTFKDPTYAKAVKEIAYHKADGSDWTDKSGNYWPNPYHKDCWDYPIALAKEAADIGFDEIQFDYIRFPSSEGSVKQIAFGFESDTKSKSEIINEFLSKVMNELADKNVTISADVFGITTKRDGDFENIGQDYHTIAQIVDVICPMVYPSHYGVGNYGVTYPDLNPYAIIYHSMEDAKERVSGDTEVAIARPYLQDFTASWLGKGKYQVYGNQAVSEQIKACFDLGIESFTLWDPSNQYCYEALPIANEMRQQQTSGEQKN